MATIVERLKEKGFKNARERRAWFDENKDEIGDFLRKNGITATLRKYNTSHRVLARFGLIDRGVGKNRSYKWVVIAPAAKSETMEQIVDRFLHTLPAETDFGDIVNYVIKLKIEEIEGLKQKLADALTKVAEKEEELSKLKEQLIAAKKENAQGESDRELLVESLEKQKGKVCELQAKLRTTKLPIANLRRR